MLKYSIKRHRLYSGT